MARISGTERLPERVDRTLAVGGRRTITGKHIDAPTGACDDVHPDPERARR